MPLNTVLAAPPLEANEMALNVFEENELQIGPEEELVSDDEEEIARKAALKREREIKNEKERERKRRIKVYSFKTTIKRFMYYLLSNFNKEEQQRAQEQMETGSNSSAVSDDTCCTCRKPFEKDDKVARCSGTTRNLQFYAMFNIRTRLFNKI